MGILSFLRWLATGKEPEGAAERKRRVTRIRRDVLELVFESAKETHPNEFAGILRAEGDTITELLLAPGTISGSHHAIFQLWNLPVDRSMVGTVHSHPSPEPFPSYADRELFSNFGHTHVIVAHPYAMHSWRAYDHGGLMVELEVVDE